MMDEPDVPVAAMRKTLDELDAINAQLGGFSTTLGLLRNRFEQAEGPVRLLDVGAGGAGTARFLRTWAVRHGVDLRVTTLDIHPAVCRVAAENTRADPGIGLVQADAFRIPFRDGAFHFAHSALFLHHFRDPEVVQLLTEMHRVASDGVVVNDLHRHVLAYHSIRLLTRLFGKSAIVQNDAPLSVRRGFLAEDLEAWRHADALAALGYRRRWPFRWAAWIFADGGTPDRVQVHV